MTETTVDDDAAIGIQYQFAQHLSWGEQIAITLAPVVSGLLSIIGSTCISRMIAADWRRNIRSIKYRLLLALSAADILNSCSFCVWALPLPADTRRLGSHG